MVIRAAGLWFFWWRSFLDFLEVWFFFCLGEVIFFISWSWGSVFEAGGFLSWKCSWFIGVDGGGVRGVADGLWCGTLIGWAFGPRGGWRAFWLGFVVMDLFAMVLSC